MKFLKHATFFLSSSLLIVANTALAAVKLENPLGSNDVPGIITKVIGWISGMVGILAMFAIVYAGLRMITAFGNEDQVRESKQIMFWAIMGIIMVALAYVVVKTVGQTLGVVN